MSTCSKFEGQMVKLSSSNSKSSEVSHFWDSKIGAEVIHHWDGAFAVTCVGVASSLRGLSGQPEGTPRQYCDGGFRAFGLRPVFHTKRVVSGVPACPGEGPWPLELSDPVRDRENPL